MVRCFIWKHLDLRAPVVVVQAAGPAAMNCIVTVCVNAVQLRSSTMSLRMRSAPIVASSFIARQAAVVVVSVVQVAVVALHLLRSCSSSMRIVLRHNPVRDV